MDNAWQRFSEVTQGTQKRAEQVVRALVRRGEVEAARSERNVEGLLFRVEQNRKAIASIVRSEIEDAVRRLGLARQSDIDRLQAKIARLEAEVRAQSTPVKAKRPPAKKAGAKKVPPSKPSPAEPETTSGEDG
ncbi:MAG: phasin family protein [Egibacteraceae bacterium]